ncbi:MAG: hypothetical protein OWQ51_05155 [Pyrobaculum arsenaticum]|uniref:Uncharacterized protein n=2 Tax=Pyrobaculum arsenaticum TaxID=121277 RepID=A4WIZ8_PYRAR|nr:hypothetical protein [Pyrobaculum arsenaticum]ABP50365.1 hypothetical protein Pars_0779 [Pyrobaculum arsenaticum DSM 13514]MCY0890353.1 hypothetical protein [Pyrobaculum arsenaticum]NYR14690.1 hypothetical protein [Pyrobaculum arsenaticum]
MLRNVLLGVLLFAAAIVVLQTWVDAVAQRTPWGKIVVQSGDGQDEIEVVILEGGRRSDRDYDFAIVEMDGEIRTRRAERGYGKVVLGAYHAKLAQIAKELGYNPTDVELGVIIEIGRLVDHNETHIAAERMIISAPLKPGKPNKIRVEVEFKPQAKTLVPKPKNSTKPHTRSTYEVQASTSPPSLIEQGCPVIKDPFSNPVYTCYEWRLVSSTKSQDTLIPSMIVYLGANDVYNAKSVSVYSEIKVGQDTGLRLTLPIGAVLSKEGKTYLLTQGFTVNLGSSTTLMQANCLFRSNKETPAYSECRDMLRGTSTTLPTYDSSSPTGAWATVGPRGVYWQVTYDIYYVAYVYNWTLRKYVITYQYKVDTATGVWSAPYAEQVGNGQYRFWPEFRINSYEIGRVVTYYNTPEWSGGPPKFTIQSGASSYIAIGVYQIVSEANTLFSTTPFAVPATLIACAYTGGSLCTIAATAATSFDVSYETSMYLSQLGIVQADLRCSVPYESTGFTIKNYLEGMGVEVYLPAVFIHLRTTARC